MFSLRIALLDLAGQVIDRKKKKITRKIMMENMKRITSGPSIQKDGDLYSLHGLHMSDLHDLHAVFDLAQKLGQTNHTIETLKDFCEKLIWTDHSDRGSHFAAVQR